MLHRMLRRVSAVEAALLALAFLGGSPEVLGQGAPLRTPADHLFADGHYLRAEPLVLAALKQTPNDPHTLVAASAIDWAFTRQDGSIALAEKAVALDGSSAEAHAQLTNALGVKLMSSSAGMLEKVSLARRFRKEAERSLQLNPNNPDSLEDMAQFYWNAPGFVGGDRSHAQQYADHLFEIDPARGAVLKSSFAAEEKDASRRLAATEAIWRKAVAARPGSYEAHIGLGNVLFDEGAQQAAGGVRDARFAQAEAEAKAAVAISATRVAAYRSLAVLYATQHRWDALDGMLKRARTAVPDDLAPEYEAAQVLLAQGDDAQLARVEQYFRAYLAQPAEGQEPTLAAAHWRLAQALERQKRKPEAIRELQIALNLDPGFDPAKKDLKRLS